MKQRVESLMKIKYLRGKNKTKFIKECSDSCIDAICEGCYNIIQGNIKLKSNQRKKAEPYKLYIRKLGDEKVSRNVKRKILSQEGGGILGVIASSVLPLLISALRRR